MNRIGKGDWPLWILIIMGFLAAILVYPHMPERVPVHWNMNGEIDGYGSRLFGTFFLPLLNLGLYALFLVLPRLDPKYENYEKFAGSYQIMKYVLILFMSVLYLVTIMASLGYEVNVGKIIILGVALLYLVLGSIMGNVKHNYFVGFRLPWTLANEEVWTKTHGFGAKWMVLGGIAALIGGVLTNGATSFSILMGAVFIPVVVTMVYSYVIYRKMK